MMEIQYLLLLDIEKMLLVHVLIIEYMDTKAMGQKIREVRKAAELSQKALAAQVGPVSSKAVSNWEAGVSFPSRDKWPALEQALDLPPGWFLSLQSGGEYKPLAKVRQAVHLRFGGPNESAADTVNTAAAKNTVPVSRYEELPSQISPSDPSRSHPGHGHLGFDTACSLNEQAGSTSFSSPKLVEPTREHSFSEAG